MSQLLEVVTSLQSKRLTMIPWNMFKYHNIIVCFFFFFLENIIDIIAPIAYITPAFMSCIEIQKLKNCKFDPKLANLLDNLCYFTNRN